MEASVVKLNNVPRTATSPRDKVRTVKELAGIAQQLRRAGKSVVQAHGTFDLLHLGHVRHLEAARALGDVLVVTITADRFVNKGPGRPVFGEALRAEMLASLHYVDWVGINESMDAVSAIELIGPSIYVKGQDYQDPQGDITGKISLERRAVESRGGRIHFTDEIVFSSTELINRHFNVFEPHVREHLDGLRENGGLAELTNLIDGIRDYRVVFVGDAIIDEYQYVLPMGKPPKESVIASRFQDYEIFAGGVFAAANHVASFCAEVDVITCLGGSDTHEELIRKSLRPNVRLHALKRPGVPTTLKRRFVDPSYMRKLFEVYVMDDEPLTRDLQGELDGLIADLAPRSNVVIVTDFGHGLIGPSSIETLVDSAPFLAVNTQSNSANMGYNLITKYPRADYVCIDAPEARLAMSDRISKIGDIAHRLSDSRIDCSKLIITHGKHGCVTYERGEIVHTIPAVARRVVDTVGAGDAFLAVTAPL
ncbi:MAG: adenylyltransferase/cytidyltransferase family protein, partial [Methylobacteriaceae bacterium]|nr:adenylyltransferase/cytidyltransferase family protein [Methylobacteriaceae bacterium]